MLQDAPVRCHEHDEAAHRGGQRLTGFGPLHHSLVEDEDAVGVGAQADLDRRAAHAVGCLPPHLPLGDLHAVGHDGADRGEGDEVADLHVERPAADLQWLPVTAIDIDELDLVGIGMGPQVEHAGEHDTVDDLADDLPILHCEPQRREDLPELVGVAIDVGRELYAGITWDLAAAQPVAPAGGTPA